MQSFRTESSYQLTLLQYQSRLPILSTQNPAYETTLQQHEVFTCPLKLILPTSVLQTFISTLTIIPLLVIFIFFSRHKAETTN